MPIPDGTQIERYHIISSLGSGGMAEVYKAFDTRLERDVAIKVIRRKAFSPEVLDRVLKRFDREAKSLAKLNHTNIVAVIDYGEYESSPYLVMPYLPGGTLKARMGKAMNYAEAASLLYPIADALAYAHQKGVIHRDVKPANILITESGQPMLTDFGVARLLEMDMDSTLTNTGAILGTPEYMAPEQGLGRGVDGRADIYALGVVFYELVTGHKPFTADTPMAVVVKQSTEPLPPPLLFAPDLPESVEKILYKALAKNPEDRYQDMQDFAKAIASVAYETLRAKPAIPESFAQEDTVYEDGATTDDLRTLQDSFWDGNNDRVIEDASSFPRPLYRRWFALGGLLVIGIMIGLIIFLKHPPSVSTVDGPLIVLTDTPTSSAIVSTSIKDLYQTTDLIDLHGDYVYQVGNSPDGAFIAVANSTGINIYSIEDLVEVLHIATDSPVQTIAYSPDGNTLASGSDDGIVRLWNITDGSLLQSVEGKSGAIFNVAFSPDGQTVAFSTTISVESWNIVNNHLTKIDQSTDGAGYGIAYSPDGRTLASGSYDGAVYLWNVLDGSLQYSLDGHSDPVYCVGFSPDGQIVASGSADGHVILWNALDGTLIATLGGNSGSVWSVAFSPDGQTLASGLWDKSIWIWDVTESSLVDILRGHTMNVRSVVFSPDGQTLVSGSYDGTVRIWKKTE